MKMKLVQDWSKNNPAGKEIVVNAIKYDVSYNGHYAVRAKLGKWCWVSIRWFVKGKDEPEQIFNLLLKRLGKKR